MLYPQVSTINVLCVTNTCPVPLSPIDSPPASLFNNDPINFSPPPLPDPIFSGLVNDLAVPVSPGPTNNQLIQGTTLHYDYMYFS